MPLLERREIQFVMFIAFLGYVFSTREFIFWLNQLTPSAGLLFYYIVLAILLFAAYKLLNVRVGGIRLQGDPLQVLGSLLILFSFFLVTNWGESGLAAAYLNTQTPPSVYMQTEDGAVWWFWQHYTQDVEALRLLTYVFTPFVLTLIGASLVSRESIGRVLGP